MLQGIEWYSGKPIFYSMGNYWFSSSPPPLHHAAQASWQRTRLGKLPPSSRLVPAWTEGGRVTAITDPEERREFFDYMQSISDRHRRRRRRHPGVS